MLSRAISPKRHKRNHVVRIGDIDIAEFPFLLAPMEDVSDPPFRALCKKYGADVMYTEFISSEGLIRDAAKSRAKLDIFEYERPIGIQIFGSEIDSMRQAAAITEEAQPDIVDINYGCPVKKVACRGAGAGILQDIPKMVAMTKEIVDTCTLPVTVKTRLGWCGSDADPVAWCRQLQDAGAQLLTLHGRTREQGFKGTSDWQAIGEVRQALTIPLIANGDINSPDDAKRCLALTGAEGVMVGRGTMGAPWLVGQIDAALAGRPVPATPDPLERLALAREHLIALVEDRGDHGLLIARKHMGWTCTGFPGAPRLRQALMRAPTPTDALALLDAQRLSLG